MKFDGIFFDSGGTLYRASHDAEPTPRSVAADATRRAHGLLSGMGPHVDFDAFDSAVAEQIGSCRARWGAGYNFFRLMQDVVQALKLPIGDEGAACLADAYAGPRYASWLFPGTHEALRTLDERGFRLGIVANTAWPGFCMDRAFAGVGLLPYLGIRIYSGDIGIEKPDPAIFRLAERISGLQGRRLLYVGNDLEKDVHGAAAAGWATAFRVAEGEAKPGAADCEFDHISQLVDFCTGG